MNHKLESVLSQVSDLKSNSKTPSDIREEIDEVSQKLNSFDGQAEKEKEQILKQINEL
jgi:hypothetical protein